ncbi:MAG TPA: HAD family phosphatase [Candidatus Merdivicinus excrementipullorum]|uniref:HAD family phosphatase n=1 Tax=Candidatus Merdivicinus excrementipullorum TaxID=2840867 RepID=A0A9D1FPN2_9FIRM|nr:HAD family phosphatase [Candidatus Merdivicinus excrementipullorum]
MEKQIKGIIFDMDGTLVDSMANWRRIGTLCMEYLGKKTGRPDFDQVIYRMKTEDVMAMFAQYGVKISSRQEYEDIYYAAIRPSYETVVPMPGILEVLEEFRSRGLKMCVATATRSDVALPVLERLGIMPYMEFLLCCKDVRAGKEKPDIYLESARRLGLSVSETVVFEDADYCVKTAKSAGFPVVGILDSTAGQEEIQYVREHSDLFLENYSQLLKILRDGGK